jgi:hypothetical protein
MVAGESYKKGHDAKANHYTLNEGDYAYLDNKLYLGKSKKKLLNDGSCHI